MICLSVGMWNVWYPLQTPSKHWFNNTPAFSDWYDYSAALQGFLIHSRFPWRCVSIGDSLCCVEKYELCLAATAPLVTHTAQVNLYNPGKCLPLSCDSRSALLMWMMLQHVAALCRISSLLYLWTQAEGMTLVFTLALVSIRLQTDTPPSLYTLRHWTMNFKHWRIDQTREIILIPQPEVSYEPRDTLFSNKRNDSVCVHGKQNATAQ